MVAWRIWHFHSQTKHQGKQGERIIVEHLTLVAKEDFQEKEGR